jgi:site-specific recombinase XerD
MKQEAFISYLAEQEKLSPRSIEEHIKNLQRFYKWATQQHYQNIDHLTYSEILNYVQTDRERGIQPQTINQRLNTIKKYYEYLKHIGLLEKNPTKKIILKGIVKTITQNILSYTELEQLYSDYLKLKPEIKNNPLTPYVKQKNNVLAGLMIWQGAISGELKKITLEHLNLEEGCIYIPKTRRGAGRELKLYPGQILQMYQYIHEARIKLKTKHNELIPGYVSDQCGTIIRQLQGLNQKVNSLSQLRASMIIHWIKVYGKRKAQYMAGHKYIGSTERFELQEMDSLTDTLLKHHPFG